MQETIIIASVFFTLSIVGALFLIFKNNSKQKMLEKFYEKLYRISEQSFVLHQDLISRLGEYFKEKKSKHKRKELKDFLNLKEVEDGSFETDKAIKQIEIENINLRTLKNFSLKLKQNDCLFFISNNDELLNDMASLLSRTVIVENGQMYYDGVNNIQFTNSCVNKHVFLADENSKIFEFENEDTNIDFLCENIQKLQFTKLHTEELKKLNIDRKKIILLQRALYNNASIYVFNKFLDDLPEDIALKFANKICDLFSDRIIVFLTKRAFNVKGIGKICMLEDGKIIESGSYESLMRNKGIYFKMQERK